MRILEKVAVIVVVFVLCLAAVSAVFAGPPDKGTPVYPTSNVTLGADTQQSQGQEQLQGQAQKQNIGNVGSNSGANSGATVTDTSKFSAFAISLPNPVGQAALPQAINCTLSAYRGDAAGWNFWSQTKGEQWRSTACVLMIQAQQARTDCLFEEAWRLERTATMVQFLEHGGDYDSRKYENIYKDVVIPSGVRNLSPDDCIKLRNPDRPAPVVVVPVPAPLPVAVPKPEPVVQIVDLAADSLFDFDKWDLKEVGRMRVGEIASKLRGSMYEGISIVGHTDAVGSDEYNQSLSERRANAVREYLVFLGVPSSRIFTQGMGKRYPVASNDTAEGRQANRRVIVTVHNARMVAK